MSNPEIFSKKVRIEIENITEFLNLINEKYAEEIQNIQENVAEEDEGIEWYADEIHLLNSVSNLGRQLATVAFYRVIEFNFKKLYEKLWSEKEIKKLNLYRFKEAKKALRKRNIDLELIIHYEFINEIRKKNNDIKHEELNIIIEEKMLEGAEEKIIEFFRILSKVIYKIK